MIKLTTIPHTLKDFKVCHVLPQQVLPCTSCLLSLPYLQVFTVEHCSDDRFSFVSGYPCPRDSPSTQVAYGVFP